MLPRVIRFIAVTTFVFSVASWTYRFIDDYVRWSEIAFYVLVPLITWALFFGPLLMLANGRKWVRIAAALLLVPTGLLWIISVLVGFFGLRIH